MNEKGLLIVISGPSGAGKSTVISHVMRDDPNCVFSVSSTTRAPRTGERDGVDYFFVDRDRFESMLKNGELFEHAEYVGNCYGTPKAPVIENIENGKNVIFDIEVQGALQIKRQCPEAVLVFVVPPSFSDVERRLRGRKTDSEEKILARLETARQEYKRANEYDYLVVNDDPETAADEIKAIITAEKCRIKYHKNLILEVY